MAGGHVGRWNPAGSGGNPRTSRARKGEGYQVAAGSFLHGPSDIARGLCLSGGDTVFGPEAVAGTNT